MRLARLLPFLFLAFSAPSFAAQDPAAATYELRVELRADQPLYSELRFELRLAMEAGSGGKEKKSEYRIQTRLEYVDELLARDQPAAGDFDVRRTYLKWDQDLTEGRGKPTPQDNSFVGSSALITRRGEKFDVELIDRLAPQKELEILLRQSGAAVWLALPASARVGETFQVDPAALVSVIVGDAFKARSSPSKFTSRSVDVDGVATLDSPLTVMVEDEESRGTFEGVCSLAVDTRGKFVRSVEWKGTTLLMMEGGGVQGKAKGTFEARLATQAGEPARKALERRIVHRSIPRKLQKGPLTIELPSHWYAVESDEAETFRTTVHGAESAFTLDVQFFDVASEEFDTVVGAAEAKLGKEFRLTGVKNIASPLGKGRTMRFESKEENVVYAFLLEFHPCGKNKMVRTRLIGPEKAFDDELREWPAFLRTFELAK